MELQKQQRPLTYQTGRDQQASQTTISPWDTSKDSSYPSEKQECSFTMEQRAAEGIDRYGQPLRKASPARQTANDRASQLDIIQWNREDELHQKADDAVTNHPAHDRLFDYAMDQYKGILTEEQAYLVARMVIKQTTLLDGELVWAWCNTKEIREILLPEISHRPADDAVTIVHHLAIAILEATGGTLLEIRDTLTRYPRTDDPDAEGFQMPTFGIGAPPIVQPESNQKAETMTEHKQQPRFPLARVKYLLQAPQALEWTVKDYLLPESSAMFFGPPEAGKSLFIIDVAASVATGLPLHGIPVKQGPVIYLAGEGFHGIRRRIKAWAIQNDAEDDLEDAPLFVSEYGAALNARKELAEVVAAIDEIKEDHGDPVLIVIDTLHRNLRGDENSSADMAAYFEAMDVLKNRFKATVVTVHHSGHGDKDRSRGSSSIRAALDTEFSVSKGDDGYFILTATKMKDAPKPAPTKWKIKQIELPWLNSDGQPETSVVCELEGSISGKDGKGFLTPSMRHAFESYLEASTFDGESFTAHLDKWRECYYQTHTADTDDAKRKAFQRARSAMTSKGMLEVINNIYLCDIRSTIVSFEMSRLIEIRKSKLGYTDMSGTPKKGEKWKL